jgi:beta-N-acetylhexosaminidase
MRAGATSAARLAIIIVTAVSNRHIRRHIGQLLISGFDGYQIPPEMRSLAREFDLGGIILFKRNVEAPEQVAEVAHSAQELANELPLWVSVDQEGGRVARLREPFTRWPPMAASASRSISRRCSTS